MIFANGAFKLQIRPIGQSNGRPVLGAPIEDRQADDVQTPNTSDSAKAGRHTGNGNYG
jgi:hypothetical protein